MSDTTFLTITILGIITAILQGIIITIIFKAIKKWFTDRK